MEKEDQLIKDLIKEGFLKSAPEDFTENVMNVVAKTKESKNSIFGESVFTYAAIVLLAIASAGIIIYFVDSSFYTINFGFFTEYLKQATQSFSGLFTGSNTVKIIPDTSFLIIGIIAIMVILLLFDKLLNHNRRLTSLTV